MRRFACAAMALVALGALMSAQVPQPFPRPQNPARPAPGALPPPAPAPPPSSPAANVAQPDSDPTEASLGFPVYPNAQFITSYDAGRGQHYYLFGSEAGFSVLVKYYQTVFKTKGTLVFEAPATHIFEIGRFDDKTMAFPPGITLKDYTWNGGAGYLNPRRDGKPGRFPSIIQIVPAPAGAPQR